MKLATLETLGYNGGDDPLPYRGKHSDERGPFPALPDSGSSETDLQHLCLISMRSDTSEKVAAFRARIQTALEADILSELRACMDDRDHAHLLNGPRFRNEKDALRLAIKAHELNYKRKGRALTRYAALQCGARAVQDAGYLAIDPPQSTGDRKGADSDLFGDRSRGNHMPIDAVRDEHGVVMAD